MISKAENFINKIICGTARQVLSQMPDDVVQMVATSPPFWAQRDYKLPATMWGGDGNCQHQWQSTDKKIAFQNNLGNNGSLDRSGVVREESTNTSFFCPKCEGWLGQLGLEPSPELFVEHLVEIFEEVKRVLRPDGTVWLNMGDSYWGGGFGVSPGGTTDFARRYPKQASNRGTAEHETRKMLGSLRKKHPILKAKDQSLIPFRLAIALQEAGWWIRSTIIWHKPNAMPSSVTDRPTTDFEYVFLMSERPRYYYDHVAVMEPYQGPINRWGGTTMKANASKTKQYVEMQQIGSTSALRTGGNLRPNQRGRNRRTVWSIPTKAFTGAHFATWPPDLARLMILAGSATKACPHCGAGWKHWKIKKGHRQRRWSRKNAKGSPYNKQGSDQNIYDIKYAPTCGCPDNDGTGRSIVLDPFAGAATTCAVAKLLGRDYIGIEANPEYAKMGRSRVQVFTLGKKMGRGQRKQNEQLSIPGWE